MRIDIITVLPELIKSPFEASMEFSRNWKMARRKSLWTH